MSVFGRAKYLAVAAERRRTKLVARWPQVSQLPSSAGAPSEARPRQGLDVPREWDASEADVRVVVGEVGAYRNASASPLAPVLLDVDAELAHPRVTGDSAAPSVGAADNVLSAPDVDAEAAITNTPRIGTAGVGAPGSRRDLVPGETAIHDTPEGPISPRRLAGASSRSAISAWAAEAQPASASDHTQAPQLPGWATPRPVGTDATAHSEA